MMISSLLIFMCRRCDWFCYSCVAVMIDFGYFAFTAGWPRSVRRPDLAETETSTHGRLPLLPDLQQRPLTSGQYYYIYLQQRPLTSGQYYYIYLQQRPLTSGQYYYIYLQQRPLTSGQYYYIYLQQRPLTSGQYYYIYLQQRPLTSGQYYYIYLQKRPISPLVSITI